MKPISKKENLPTKYQKQEVVAKKQKEELSQLPPLFNTLLEKAVQPYPSKPQKHALETSVEDNYLKINLNTLLYNKPFEILQYNNSISSSYLDDKINEIKSLFVHGLDQELYEKTLFALKGLAKKDLHNFNFIDFIKDQEVSFNWMLENQFITLYIMKNRYDLAYTGKKDGFIQDIYMSDVYNGYRNITRS